MKNITGDYWQDLNIEIFEACRKIGESPTINQKRDLSILLMHVLESENGILENDLRYRTNLKDMRFLAMKQMLTQAGLIRSDMSLNVMPTEKIRYLVRKIYHSQNGNNGHSKHEVLTIPESAEIKQKESVPAKKIQDKKEIKNKNADISKSPVLKIIIEAPKQATTINSGKKPHEPFVVPIIINKGHIGEIQKLLDKNEKTGIDLKVLFEKWKLPYSKESISRLIFYLGKNNVDSILKGDFPKITLFRKN